MQTQTIIRLRREFSAGKRLHRGERALKFGQVYSSDAGDFGRGIYYSTSYSRACQYGTVHTRTIRLYNPLILSDQEAYSLSDHYETVKLRDSTMNEIFNQVSRSEFHRAVSARLLFNSQRMTNSLVNQGYDGLISIRLRGGELEVVCFKGNL